MASPISRPGWRSMCRRGRGSIRPTRCRTLRSANSPRRSRAKSCSSGCTRNCPTTRRSKPKSGRNCAAGDIRIEQTIYVERESQRKIVLGKGGQTIKAIGEAARKEIGEHCRSQGAPVSVREGARRLGRRSGTLPRDGTGVSEGLALSFDGPSRTATLSHSRAAESRFCRRASKRTVSVSGLRLFRRQQHDAARPSAVDI